MIIIMSLWTKPCINGKAHGFNTVQDMINSLIVSCNVAKKHYPDIHFYTDKIGYEWIKPHLHLLPFTKIEICLDEINWLDDLYWSLGKMYVYSLQKEPFIHIDNDVFIWDGFGTQVLQKDFLFQEIEWFDVSHFYKVGLDVYNAAIPKEIKVLNAAFNCGVFGCLTEKALKLINKYYEVGYKFVKKTNVIPNIKKVNNRHLASVIIEQVFIYSLVMDNNLSYDTLLDHNKKQYKIKYTHQIADTKRNKIIEDKIKERIHFKNWD